VSPARSRAVRVAAIAAVALAALVAIAAGLYLVAARSIESAVLESLGPNATIGTVRIRPGRVEIERLSVAAPEGWPARETLAARRVVVVPELSTLLGARVRIASVIVEDAYLSVLRTGDGRVRLLPRLLKDTPMGEGEGAPHSRAPGPPASRAEGPAAPAQGTPAAAPPDAAHSTTIGRIVLRGGTLEFFDASVRRPPHALRIEAVSAELDDLVLPALDARTRLRLDGTVKAAAGRSPAHDGIVSIEGWAVPSTRDSQLRSRLRGVDLVALQPYLLRAADAGVRAGTLDLELASRVERARLRAPGRLALTGLELAPASGPFLGLPREAVLALLKNRAGRIELDFMLDGRLDDPRFSLSEDLAVRVAAGLAESLGVGLGDIARGVGGAGQRAIDAASGALRGLLGR
jgi:hypothetical protein